MRIYRRRFWKNFFWSAAGWLFVNTVFFLEVAVFGMGEQTAHMTKTPIGTPVGIAIQLFVFRDRLEIITSQDGKRSKLELVSLWVVSKASFFALNLIFFNALVIQGGAPFWVAPFVISPIASVIHYWVDTLGVFAVRRKPQTETP
jgi:hypothetical protein